MSTSGGATVISPSPRESIVFTGNNNIWFPQSPYTNAIAAKVMNINYLHMAPAWWSGAAGVTITGFSINIAVTFTGSNGVVRIGVYQPINQTNPFGITPSTLSGPNYATLVAEAGTITTSGAVVGLYTLDISGSPIVIPPATWFCVAGVVQADISGQLTTGQITQPGSSPIPGDINNTYTSANSYDLTIVQTAVSGALPATAKANMTRYDEPGVAWRALKA